MRKERMLLILGVWVVVLPYLGFPSAWKDVLFFLTGLGLIYLAYSFYNQFKKEKMKYNTIEEKIFDNFKENSPDQNQDSDTWSEQK